jgi:hypothetical protein
VLVNDGDILLENNSSEVLFSWGPVGSVFGFPFIKSSISAGFSGEIDCTYDESSHDNESKTLIH